MKLSDCVWKPSASGKWVDEDIVGEDPGGGRWGIVDLIK